MSRKSAESVLKRAEDYLTQAGLIDQSGAVLYGGVSTLRAGPVYLVGLNPGGSEGTALRHSIAASMRDHNAYLDEQWAPGGHLQPMGEAILQRRVRALCTRMGLETRNVPASNLVFTRSSRLKDHLGFNEALKLCRPVHELFLDAIRPRFLMTFGSIANFKKAVALTSIESRSAKHDNWEAHRGTATWGEHSFAFGNIPHMSIWSSDSRPEVVDWAIDGFKT